MLTLRPYQQEGIDFLRTKKRAMLCDAPGIGKSFQAAEALRQYGPVLVSAPTYLTEQWYDFLTEQYPSDGVVLASGTRVEREASLKRRHDWLIINHEMMRLDKKGNGQSYKIVDHPSIIFDESHHLRGRKSQQHAGALALAKKAEYVAELTATPVQREIDDFYGQLRILDPDNHWLHSYWRFHSHFFRQAFRMGRFILEAKAHFKKFLDNYKLERSYSDVGLYLPDLINNVVHVRMSKQVESVYKSLRDDYRSGEITLDSAAQLLPILRGLTSGEKIESTIGLAQEFPSFCVFTWYRDSASTLAQRLRCPCIDGSIEPGERKRLAQSNNRVVATIASLSEGVDLSHIRTVIFFEEDYTPGAMYQALSRLRRWSQQSEESSDPVLCYYMLVRNSIDETVHRIQSRRAFTVRDLVKMELSR